ncbi:MAG: hypothetical protein ACK53Y_09935, partial [bacterium]
MMSNSSLGPITTFLNTVDFDLFLLAKSTNLLIATVGYLLDRQKALKHYPTFGLLHHLLNCLSLGRLQLLPLNSFKSLFLS